MGLIHEVADIIFDMTADEEPIDYDFAEDIAQSVVEHIVEKFVDYIRDMSYESTLDI
jgi:hypothetical protein